MKTLVAILLIAIAGASGIALYFWRELDSQRSRVAELEAKLKDVESRQASITALANRWNRAASVDDATASDDSNDTASAAARRPEPDQAARVNGAIREVLTSPEVRGLARNLQRTLLEQRYPDLANVLNLSPEEADKLFDLLAKQQTDLRGNVRSLAARGDGGGANIQDLQRVADEMRQATENEMAALLGTKYPQWQEYERTQPARVQVNQLQSTLAADGIRLSNAQSGPLLTALAAEQQRIDQENRIALAASTDTQQYLQTQQQRNSDNNRRLILSASPYLTPQQLDSYQKMLERQQSTASRVIDALGGRRGQAGGGTAP